MKKTILVFLLSLLLILASLPTFAAQNIEPARGNIDEVFRDADLHCTFDNTTGKDITKNHSVMPYGTCTHVSGRYGRAMCMQYNLNSLQVKKMGFGSDSFTFSAWFRITFYAGLPMLFTNRDLSSVDGNAVYHDPIADLPGWSLYLCWNGDLAFSANAEGATPFYGTFPTASYFPSTNSDSSVWHHVVLTVDREIGEVSLYVDNKQVGDSLSLPTDHAGKSYDTAEKEKDMQLMIADDLSRDYQDTQHLIMYIDEIAAFKRVLTEEEIAAIYDYVPEVPEMDFNWRPVTDDSGEWVIANPSMDAETAAPVTEPVDSEESPPETEAPQIPSDTEPDEATPDESDDAYGGGTADGENKSGLMVVDTVIIVYGLLCVVLLLCLFFIPKKKQ